jgi:polar amino acid transport system permease protein
MAFAVPLAFHWIPPGGLVGAGIVGLVVTYAAYMAETLRAGIQAVPKGQMEAARSLGMSQGRAMISVVVPQAFRIILPPLTNELILLTKDSSLVYILGLSLSGYELTKFGRESMNSASNLTPIIVVGLCYLLITVPLSIVVRRMESRSERAR